MKSATLFISLSFVFGLAGCATGIDEDETPIDAQDNPVENFLSAEAHLLNIWDETLPDERPYELESIVGGDLEISMRLRGGRYTLSFAEGSVDETSESQVIATGDASEDETEWLTLMWPTRDFGATAAAGSNPSSDDIFSLMLTAMTESEGTTLSTQTDTIQIQLDNTPPISKMTRICLDAEAEHCYSTTESPEDYGAELPPSGVITLSQSETNKLYIYGIALDRHFDGYTFRMIGGEATSATHLCWANTEENAACTGTSLVESAGAFGFGTARDIHYSETLSLDQMVDGYSEDALLLVWDISYLSPDAYGLNLVSFSEAHIDGDDDAQATSTWTTLLINDE